MPHEPVPPAPTLGALVEAALAQVPMPTGNEPLVRHSRAAHRQLREEIESRRADYHARLHAGVSLREIHRVLCDQLKRSNVAPIAYNTLREWLSPLP